MRAIAVSFVSGPERCAVTEMELDDSEAVQAWSLDSHVRSAVPCPNRPYSLSHRLYGVAVLGAHDGHGATSDGW